MNARRLTLTETVCLETNDGYDGDLILRRDDEYHLHMEIEGADLEIRLTKLDVMTLQKWLATSLKASKSPDPDEGDDSESEQDESEDLIDGGGRRRLPKTMPTSPPVGDGVLIQRLITAQALVTNRPDNSDLHQTATKYLRAQLTLPTSNE